MCEQTGYRVKRVEKKKNRKRTKTPRPKPGKSFEREDLENAFEITIKAHRIRFVKKDDFGSVFEADDTTAPGHTPRCTL